ncbi:SDR family NAD(P)-dependent oxidoreductase [Ruminococcus sp.]|uniref:SDR family NAD(P)-dependent oxidoreductase n=1 Tax=Ruminococcus sp. TaxID=41978 RepID=UPI003890776A
MNQNKRVAVVTGGSSGIGKATASALLQRGCAVYELSRRDNPPPGVRHLTADITDEEQVKAAIGEIMSREGHIDILINNAGYGISGAAELTASADAHAQLELNLFGMDNVTRAVLPHMRKQRSGRIVCVSSIAGILPIPFQLWYSVSKSAVAAYVLALQNEVRPYGVTVCAALPGDIATGFTDARKKNDCGHSDYSARVRRSVAVMEQDERSGMSPEKAGAFIAGLALKKRSRPLNAIGFSYKAVAAMTKLLPRRLSNYIVGKIYAK